VKHDFNTLFSDISIMLHPGLCLPCLPHCYATGSDQGQVQNFVTAITPERVDWFWPKFYTNIRWGRFISSLQGGWVEVKVRKIN